MWDQSAVRIPGPRIRLTKLIDEADQVSLPETAIESIDGGAGQEVAESTVAVIGEGRDYSIRKLSTDGVLSIVPGTGNCSRSPSPGYIAIDSQGRLYVAPAVLRSVYSIMPSGRGRASAGRAGWIRTGD
jgi:hypothetical protein